ncbi:hypothetical protein ACFPYN_06955 [Paenisporosarcina macmurdoensis]|uniref:Uncharacterized protein n=1 Tax=Paenisporosarcina macmurdoensis TaxID=212659 RepID=A0ABW1L5C1_9BACL
MTNAPAGNAGFPVTNAVRKKVAAGAYRLESMLLNFAESSMSLFKIGITYYLKRLRGDFSLSEECHPMELKSGTFIGFNKVN